ncbi:MAG: glycosyltransferase, partial [Pirellulaceae bacterium]|nr:glycosyltransferase [Pirellulaceae bacterium]
MNTLVYILVGMLLLLTLHGWCAAIGFSVVLLRARREEVRRDELPRTAILMGLKGSDPDLLDGLQRLMRLDYPDYELHIVVDSETDPAWPVVHEAIAAAEADHVHVETYAPSAATGPVNSTNSKQMQLLQKLDDSFEVVAMADGDLIAHPDWLRDLVAPLLRDDKVAATFGNRWFMPEESHMGSLVRYTWGVAAAISMCFLSMPWGGCFAIKMSVVRKLNLIEKWSQFIAFDAATPGDLKRA